MKMTKERENERAWKIVWKLFTKKSSEEKNYFIWNVKSNETPFNAFFSPVFANLMKSFKIREENGQPIKIG